MPESTPAVVAGFQLPILATAAQSYRFAWSKRSAFAIPLLLVFISKIGIGLYSGMIEARDRKTQAIMALPDLVLILATIIFAMSVAVGIHRTVVLGEDRSGLRFWRHIRTLGRYFWAASGFFVLWAVFSFVLALIFARFAVAYGWWHPPAPVGHHIQRFPAQAIWAATALFALIFLRFMLVLPAAAVGDEGGYMMSFTATRKNWFRLTAIAFLTALPWIALTVLSAALTADQINEAMISGSTPHYYFDPVYLTVTAAIYAIELAVFSVMLSISYSALVSGRTPVQ